MGAVVGIGFWNGVVRGASSVENLDMKRMAFGDVGGMGGAAIPAGACAERAQKVDLGPEFEGVTGPCRAGFHKILTGVFGKAGAHKDVENVVDVQLGLPRGEPGFGAKCAGEV